ncbi:MAG TPA: hypothetical protein VGF48_19425 [Thermoanaerobaculia bacterium]|jgi:hypothetical protein
MSEEFTYTASALGLGGVINVGGKRTVISSRASVALAPTGGEGHAVESNFSAEGISFDHAESHVVGFDNGNHRYTTYSDVLITGLNIFNRLRIGLMRATVESSHDLGSRYSEFRLQAEYRDVSIDGYEIVPELDIDLKDNCETYSKITAHLGSHATRYERQYGLQSGMLAHALVQSPPPPLQASLVEKLQVYPVKPMGGRPPVPGRAYGLTVENFGRAHFAEYQVKPGRRRVTLLRLDLNSMQQLAAEQFQTQQLDTEQLEMQQLQTDAMNGGSEPQAAPLFMLNAAGPQYDGTVSVTSLDGNGSPPWDR